MLAAQVKIMCNHSHVQYSVAMNPMSSRLGQIPNFYRKLVLEAPLKKRLSQESLSASAVRYYLIDFIGTFIQRRQTILKLSKY